SATTTMRASERSAGSQRRSTSSIWPAGMAAGASRISSESASAITVTRAPDAARRRAFQAAPALPPMTTAGFPPSGRNTARTARGASPPARTSSGIRSGRDMRRLLDEELLQLGNATAAIGPRLQDGADGGGVRRAVADRLADGLDADAEAGADD